ncbi:MAG: hypothetical protein NVSMB62_07700 [Acidobacteriaceae bacterium]
MVLIVLLIGAIARSNSVTYVLMFFSMCATARYAVWRVDSLRRYFFSPWSSVNALDAFFMLLLLGAELYSFLILYLGFVQTIAPLRRTPVALPADTEQWPFVDVMIPTYNEPLDVVRYTILAAKQQDWPEHKFKIWVLDDGERDEFRRFAEEAGVGYLARTEHSHAKAGNINHALARTDGDLVAIFDCDHVPTRSFLQITTGWFLRDARLGMLQTPHHFYSADPFEKNLGNFRRIPSEGELFYGIIQDTNDLWNATFFCGSCAVLRRSSLDEVGGIAHETVTEDAHTSLRMQKKLWNTAYLNLPQSAGLATETMADHVKQRTRWARGMIQILRVDNPLFARGLSVPQRLCYLNAMLHFLYALPRLVFLTAPILYLVFGKLNIPGYWLAILVFALPHLVIANVINSRVQGYRRYSFWNEIYETVLSPYILLPTLFALISPKFGKFNVTAKGQNLQEDSFDGKLARPFLVLLALNGLALIMAIPRYMYWDIGHAGTVVMNVIWTLFNMVVLTVALSACWESRQRRQSVRVSVAMPLQVTMKEQVVAGMVRDLSVSGASFTAASCPWQAGDTVEINFPLDDASHVHMARIVGVERGRTRIEFEISSIAEQESITRLLYLASDRWVDWTDGRQPDNILGSLAAVFLASLTGVGKMSRLFRRKERAPKSVAAAIRTASVILILLATSGAGFCDRRKVAVPKTEDGPTAVVHVGFNVLGAHDGILLNSRNRNQTLDIALPENLLIQAGVLHLKYSLPQAKEAASTLEVLLNDLLIASVTPSGLEVARGQGEIAIPLPPEQMVRQNRITLQLASNSGDGCAVADSAKAPIHIDADSEIELKEQRLVLANELSLLPSPFAQRSAAQLTTIPVVFGHAPDNDTLQAAGVLASWFGSLSTQGDTRFETSLGTLPEGNAVLVLLGDEHVGGVGGDSTGQAELRTLPNPVDPYGKLLVLSGLRAADLLRLAQALATNQLGLGGERATVGAFALPPRRRVNDAPRWVQGERLLLTDLTGREHLSTVGDNPLNVYFRMAPDTNFGVHRDMYLHLVYGSDATELDSQSNLVVRLNGSPSQSIPLRGAATARPKEVNVALGDLPSSAYGNTLQAQFYFVPPHGHECQPNRFTASVGGSSYLDLGSVMHLAKLPNLNLFSNAGFPFTRRADLSETAVLLPANPSTAEISEYLDLLAYFGRSTGYPATRIAVGEIHDARSYELSDLLILGSYSDIAAVPEVMDHLPLRMSSESWQLSYRARASRWTANLLRMMRTGETDHALDDGVIAPAGVIEAIESPFHEGRSAVVVLARDEISAGAMRDALLQELPHDRIRGSVSLWQGGQFTSYNFGTATYWVGDVSLPDKLALILPYYPFLLVIALVLLAFILTAWMKVSIAARIRHRLMGAPQFEERFERGRT